jgi:hypothetical protein
MRDNRVFAEELIPRIQCRGEVWKLRLSGALSHC